ncbi:MAG: PAS domain-containing sensor histidine kinase [Sediminibacterium sp.]|nr:PAS domain-containing sensor histidine kinase [Sediminibacterium sp.]
MNDLRSKEISFLLNSISDAVLFETHEHTILFVNRAFCEFFKIEAEPSVMIGMNCSNAAVESANMFKNPAFFLSRIENIYANLEPVLNEEVKLSNGTSIYRDYFPWFDEDVLCGHLWIYKPAIATKDVISQSETQRSFYEHLINNVPADIAIFDLSHRYIYLNKTGLANDETRNWLIGKDDFDYCHHMNKHISLAKNRREKFQEALRKNETVEFEEVNLTRDKKKVYNLRRFTPIQGTSGKIEYVIGYGINITRIKESEEVVSQNYEYLRELVDSIGQLVVTIDTAGNIIYVNPQWTNVTGLTGKEVAGKSIFSYLQQGVAGFYKNLDLALQNKPSKELKEMRVVISDSNQQPRTLSYYITRFTQIISADKIFAVFFTDITDQLNAEKELMNAAIKERNLSELKTNFMTMVSHELRTPLSVILSSTEILEMKYDRIADVDLTFERTYLSRIVDQVDKMTHLMNEFLFISKIESGKIMAQYADVDVQTLVQQLMNELYMPWKDGRTLNLEYKGVPRNVLFDASMLRHILTNLLSNAFKYSPSTPTPPLLKIRYSKQHWYITVIDRGIGISKEDQKAICNPFVRGTNVGDIEGTGLGLMTIQFFTDQHSGVKMLRSAPGKGTIVVLKFPYHIEKARKND